MTLMMHLTFFYAFLSPVHTQPKISIHLIALSYCHYLVKEAILICRCILYTFILHEEIL